MKDVTDLSVIAGGEVIEIRKFRVGSKATLRHQVTQALTVLGYAQDPRTGEVRTVVAWFKDDGVLCEAALPEDVLDGGESAPSLLEA